MAVPGHRKLFFSLFCERHLQLVEGFPGYAWPLPSRRPGEARCHHQKDGCHHMAIKMGPRSRGQTQGENRQSAGPFMRVPVGYPHPRHHARLNLVARLNWALFSVNFLCFWVHPWLPHSDPRGCKSLCQGCKNLRFWVHFLFKGCTLWSICRNQVQNQVQKQGENFICFCIQLGCFCTET